MHITFQDSDVHVSINSCKRHDACVRGVCGRRVSCHARAHLLVSRRTLANSLDARVDLAEQLADELLHLQSASTSCTGVDERVHTQATAQRRVCFVLWTNATLDTKTKHELIFGARAPEHIPQLSDIRPER